MKFLQRKKEHNTDGEIRHKSVKYELPDQQQLTFNSNKLVPVVIQDEISREVLHLGYMDRFALSSSLERGIVFLFRRSKGQLELFGNDKETEYHIQSVSMDRSHRSLLIQVKPVTLKNVSLNIFRSFVYPVKLSSR